MDHQHLISYLRERRHPEIKTLDEYYAEAGDAVIGRMIDISRRSPGLVDDDAVRWAAGHRDTAAGAFFALLINLMVKDEKRRPALREVFRKHVSDHPEEALSAAGHWLHEYCRFLDPEWIDLADRYYDKNPEGSWGVVYAAAQYSPSLLNSVLLDRFETRRAARPRAYFITQFSMAHHHPEQAPDFLARALRAFPDHPAEAVDAAVFAAADDAHLVTSDMVEALLRHFGAAPEKAWEYFERAVKAKPAMFDDLLLDRLNEKAKTDAGKLISITRKLIDAYPDRGASLMDRYVALVRRFPEKGIHDVRYDFQRGDMRLIRPDLVKAVCAGFSANAYPAYEFLWDCVTERPELIGPPEVEAALRNIEHATNRAFGFFRELVKLRPEFTREGTLALFEALAREPVHRAFVRQEEMEGIIAISEAAHVKTGLENALREPLRYGSRRARALMAIMFRQKLRARRHVLLEALRYAANIILWRTIPGTAKKEGGSDDSEKYSPVWDFLMFIIDNSGENAVSTAAGERFLEGTFQLHYLCQTGAEHGDFLRKLDTGYPAPHPFPPGTEFLDADANLAHLYRLVAELGKRFGVEPRLAPLREFADRIAAAERELHSVEGEKEKSDGSRRRRLGERRHSLKSKITFWKDPQYLKAFNDKAAEEALSEEGRSLLRREKKDLTKQMRDALRAEAIHIAVAAVERSRLELYRKRLKDALGRDVDLGVVEPRILPAFLWFPAISNLRNNTRYLKRLIEDRLEHRPHDWLRTEPPVLEWAALVKKGQPGVLLERWRASFEREFNYRPKDALAEKRRRIKADLAQARVLLEKAGAQGIASDAYDELSGKLAELRNPPPQKEGEDRGKERLPLADPALLEEVSMNLERVRLAEQTPDSDFEGRILLTVETDPFEILFMGEYGFASCLSLRGSNAWSAVSNAIDLDKVIVWAKEPGGNVVGRRLIALTPEGVLTFRTYTNRHGLALDRAFDEFVEAYAAHCGVKITHGGHPKPLLSDRWYDDGAL